MFSRSLQTWRLASNDKYRSRLDQSEQMFYKLEDRLLNFLEYIPFYIKHLEVYSDKLVTIILEVDPEIFNDFDLAIFYEQEQGSIDSAIMQARKQLLNKEKKLRKNRKSLTFKAYYDFLNTYPHTKISSAIIGLSTFHAYVMPFEQVKSDWWDSYNDLRHNKYTHLKHATLRNAIASLAALYWLVHTNIERSARTVDDYLSSELFYEASDEYEQNSYKL